MKARPARDTGRPLAATVAVVSAVLVTFPGQAFELGSSKASLHEKVFFIDELYISTSNAPVDLQSMRRRSGDALQRFLDKYGANFHFYLDPRSGALASLIGRVPMIPGPGAGNGMTLDDMSADLGRAVSAVDSRVVGELVGSFVVEIREVIGIDPNQLGSTHSAPVGDHLWQIGIPQQFNGIPVRHARLAATINHGNLVLLGTESWGDIDLDTQPLIDDDQAMAIGFTYAEGRDSADKVWKKPSLEIVPYAPPEYQEGDRFAGPVGRGYAHRLVWVFGFQRPPGFERWEVLVDAHTGDVVSFQDTNHYTTDRVVGGVYPLTSTEVCPTNETCGTMQLDYPMHFADTGQAPPHDFTNSAGLYEYLGGTVTTTLDGRFVRVADVCGSISENTVDGFLDLGGVNGDHDCTSWGSSPGNTPASRTCFYELNKMIEIAKGWLPGNTWLQSQLTANVNYEATCNAFYNGSEVTFFQSGDGCRNTGENAAILDHEWGHGMDDNDAVGAMSSSSEAYADIAAIYRLQTSCMGYGEWHTIDQGCGKTSDLTGYNANESQTGTHCDLDCSGGRDADWDMHEDHNPDTPQNWNCVHCRSGSGPCGSQPHCSAAPSRQAAWDFVARDLRAEPFNYDETTAFIIGNKLFYQGSGNIASWHTCTCPDTSGGCGAANAYMQWLAADDDNGNLNDGTPHMTALYAAFSRHNIACEIPAPINGGCDGGPTEAPALSILIGGNSLALEWTEVPGALAYRVFRTEGHAGCDLGKALIATVTGTSYTDREVANERPYSYVAQAVGSSGACFGPASACETATPMACAGSIGFGAGVYNCSDSFDIRLVDSDLVGAGTRDVTIRSETEVAPEALTLVESPPGSGYFAGSFVTTAGPAAAGDGMLSVADGDTITAEYVDASYCGTPDVNVARTVAIDCTGPLITGVHATNITGQSATVAWVTDELADSGVMYDLANPPVAGSATEPGSAIEHSVHLAGLEECSTYYYSAQSTDLASNSTADDNSGQFYTFETGKNVNPTYETLDPPSPIPDDDPAGALGTIVVVGSETIEDVNVTVNVTHTHDGDLQISLIGPDDTTVILSNRRGSSGQDFIGTVFDDEAGESISDGEAPFTGSFVPDEPLSAFDGMPVAGTWTLRVEDMRSADVGTLENWSVEFLYPPQSCGPHLTHQSYGLDDACIGTGTGGGNGIAEAGEDNVASVMVKNNGTEPTTGITARLTTTTPGVTVTRSTAVYPDLEAGQSSGSLSEPFVFTVATDVPCGTTIDFTLETACNEGAWNDVFSILVGAPGFQVQSYDSLDVPHQIENNRTFTSALYIPDTGVVSDVDIGVTLTHTYDGDLDIFLIGPEGTRVELTTDNGGSGNNFTGTVFDDEASISITQGSAPFSGSYRPEGSLADLNGVLAAGTWTLEIRDDSNSDTGELLAWSVILTTEAGPVCSNCSVTAPVSDPWLQWSSQSRNELEWTPGAGATFYSLYRGEMADLPNLANGEIDSCHRLTTLADTTGETLTEIPAAGSVYWFLVRSGNAGGEGPAGDSSLGPRVQDSGGVCP